MEAIRDLEPGTRVPSERELTLVLGVSRSTLREALQSLALLGAIEVRHGQGVFVAAQSPEADTDELVAALAKGVTQDLMEARRIIIVEVARLAAQRRSGEDLADLEAALKAQRRAIAAHRTPAPEGTRFDIALAQAAHNEVLQGVLRSFSKLITPAARHVYDTSEDFWLPDVEQHQAIFEAIRLGDADLVAERMLAHISGVSTY
jgi:GntR family transcriptional repressor for pyruvate dehydrogenase complex